MIIQIFEIPPKKCISMLQLLPLAKRSAVSSPLLPTCQASGSFSHSSRLGVRGLSIETVMEGGRQGSQSSAAMLCAIFHSVLTAVQLLSYTLHYFLSI